MVELQSAEFSSSLRLAHHCSSSQSWYFWHGASLKSRCYLEYQQCRPLIALKELPSCLSFHHCKSIETPRKYTYFWCISSNNTNVQSYEPIWIKLLHTKQINKIDKYLWCWVCCYSLSRNRFRLGINHECVVNWPDFKYLKSLRSFFDGNPKIISLPHNFINTVRQHLRIFNLNQIKKNLLVKLDKFNNIYKWINGSKIPHPKNHWEFFQPLLL